MAGMKRTSIIMEALFGVKMSRRIMATTIARRVQKLEEAVKQSRVKRSFHSVIGRPQGYGAIF
jgi:lipoate-protein ligase A